MSTRFFAVVTGGSNGIGLELARHFATNGYDLLTAAEVRTPPGGGRAGPALRRRDC